MVLKADFPARKILPNVTLLACWEPLHRCDVRGRPLWNDFAIQTYIRPRVEHVQYGSLHVLVHTIYLLYIYTYFSLVHYALRLLPPIVIWWNTSLCSELLKLLHTGAHIISTPAPSLIIKTWRGLRTHQISFGAYWVFITCSQSQIVLGVRERARSRNLRSPSPHCSTPRERSLALLSLSLT
jgi:hypothetical protein